MSAPRRQQEPDLPRIPVRLPEQRTPPGGDFFRQGAGPRTWPRESEPQLAPPGSGPSTEEFSVEEFGGGDWFRTERPERAERPDRAQRSAAVARSPRSGAGAHSRQAMPRPATPDGARPRAASTPDAARPGLPVPARPQVPNRLPAPATPPRPALMPPADRPALPAAESDRTVVPDIADPEEPRPEGGRHRGPRKPAFRAAVPVAAVLAAGGGALALIHATGAGAASSQALDMASDPPGSAVTTDLSNAPASVDAKATPMSTSGSAIVESPAAQSETLSSTGGWSQAPGRPTPHGSPDPAGTVITGQATIQPSGGPSTLPVQGPGSFSSPPLPGFTTTSSASAAGSPSTPPPPTSTPTPPTPTTPPSTDPSSPPSTPPSSAPPPTGTPSGTGLPSPSGSASQPPAPGGTSTSPTPIPPQTRILQSGDTGPDVSDLQTRLDRLVSPPWLPVTGVYDARTARAVAHLQQQLNIIGDPVGVFGPSTYTRLMELTTT